MRVVDQLDRPVSGQVVNFVVVSGGGSVFAGAAATDADGRAADIWRLGNAAGEQSVEIRAVTPDCVPQTFGVFTATAIPGPAAQLNVQPDVLVMFVGDVNSLDTIRVVATDKYGNTIERSRLVYPSRRRISLWTVTRLLRGAPAKRALIPSPEMISLGEHTKAPSRGALAWPEFGVSGLL